MLPLPYAHTSMTDFFATQLRIGFAALALLSIPAFASAGTIETGTYNIVSTPSYAGINCVASANGGSAGLSQQDCEPAMGVEDYQLSGISSASYGTLRAVAQVIVTDAIFPSASVPFSAGSSADFKDTITIDANVPAGTKGSIIFDIGFTGTATATRGGFAEGSIQFRAESSTDLVAADGRSSSTNPGLPALSTAALVFEFGDEIQLRMGLRADAQFAAVESLGTVGIQISGAALAAFGSTGRITGITVMDEFGGVLDETQYSFDSGSGQLVVPEPGTALLMASGLLLLAGTRRSSVTGRRP